MIACILILLVLVVAGLGTINHNLLVLIELTKRHSQPERKEIR